MREFLTPPERPSKFDLNYIKGIAEYQFGHVASNLLFQKNSFFIRRSINTQKIREVLTDSYELFLVLRAQTSLFSLTTVSARVLLDGLQRPRFRVVVMNSVKDYIKVGQNVFCKHIISADPGIRSGDEAIVVDEEDELIGVGRAKVSGLEMNQIRRGMAVSMKRGVIRDED
ncbi:PUA domain-containing protein [Sulfuracidifex tepidarius]|uniref:tRNA-guanine(15) transglycosylase n=1 Tax=Sulfuracidifex tepidarius TaxID=1294262 RepID=A0A510E400_9CREN|nr:PUA domain-containing protein [Sulfuracidifex tepidarius]BBG24448.1 tRNA-guanine(15) transglycosylase [Sulfuracidifex tepidarius]BBG27206.1 tRNA-guanine(15) transglycosylase [Sulfuracidifex tepidarius]